VQLLTTEQVARHLSVNVTTVRRWIDEGRLPATKLGRAYRVHPRDLRAVLRANMRHSSALVTGPGGAR
jgi:excisionase family DNA binding protein